MAPATMPPSSVRTLPDLLAWRAKTTPWRPAYSEFDAGRDAWREVTWRGTGDAVRRISHLLASLRLEHGARVALLLPNGHRAACLDLAVLASGLVPVPLHALDNPASIAYILQDTAAQVLVVDSAAQWRAIRALGAPPGSLRLVLVRRDPEGVVGKDGAASVLSLDDWLNGPGVALGLPLHAPGEDDLAAIVYTSGTTGRPKGVMLTHANVMSNVRACLARFEAREDDVFLSFLPLSHTFERTAGFYLPIAAGSCVAYARSVQSLPDDLLRTRPTILVSVPRIYEKVQAQIETTIAGSWLARVAFRCAVAAGWRRHLRDMELSAAAEWLRPLDALLTRLLDARVGAPLRARFGGRLRVAVSGGAALVPDIARTFIGLGIEIVQGYGMTESSPVVTANAPGDNDPATVGRPLDGVEVRIGPSLELQVRGPNVMRGYWNRPEDTAAAFCDGWLRTGDQAAIEDGRVRILGRIKEIIVTATGEKIAPVDVEQALMRDPLIEQAYVFGEGRPFIGCVLQLQAREWAFLCGGLGLDAEAPESLFAPEAVRAVEARMTARTATLPRHGQPRRAILTLAPWTTDNGLLTPTLKLKRRNLQARFASEIEQLYEG
ncbi:MAG TPA: long-chain fatty acid--CoA ligase [Burkholderiaceae bacterium]